MSTDTERKFVVQEICLKCGYPKQYNERTCRKCGGPMGERVVKRVPISREQNGWSYEK
jgi:ribosomal protein L40E